MENQEKKYSLIICWLAVCGILTTMTSLYMVYQLLTDGTASIIVNTGGIGLSLVVGIFIVREIRRYEKLEQEAKKKGNARGKE